MRLKTMIAIAAMGMTAIQPVAASAAAPAQKLSLRHSVPAAARVSSAQGKSRAVGVNLILLIAAGVAGAAVIAAAAGSSDSN